MDSEVIPNEFRGSCEILLEQWPEWAQQDSDLRHVLLSLHRDETSIGKTSSSKNINRVFPESDCLRCGKLRLRGKTELKFALDDVDPI